MPKEKTQEEMRKERFGSASKFSDAVVKKYGPLVKCVVTWGSIMRKEHTFKETSDIDCVVIVDDTHGELTDIQRAKVDDEVHEIANKVDKRISVQPVWFLTEFWDMVRTQSPLAYSVLREGYALYDTGFFIPLRKLYAQGKFPATIEAAYLKMEPVARRIQRVEMSKVHAVFDDLFYAMFESAQAVIMFLGHEPPGIRGSPDAVVKYLVAPGLLEEKYAKDMQKVVKFHKAVEHGEIKKIKGAELDRWISLSKRFVVRFNVLLKKLENDRKASSVVRASDTMVKASMAALRIIGKLPEDPKDLPGAFKHLFEEGGLNPNYSDLLNKMLEMRAKLNSGKLDDIKEEEVYYSQQYVMKFLEDVKRMLREHKFVKRMK